jgi:hypothetical protein
VDVLDDAKNVNVWCFVGNGQRLFT